jgi:LytS/YehU family sensor histidine kinase
MYWAGLAWAMLISFTIWHGNRYFLLKQRQHFDWFRHAFRKIILLTFACVFYTAPLTVVMMLAWYRIGGFGPDWNVIRTVTLACVICVAFITHVYETVYLIQQRETDQVAFERLERARTQAELDALRAQVAPHFLFNSLNTLSWLIENSPPKALDFNQNLAEVYRYILLARRRDLVTLAEEWEFLSRYIALLKLRFDNSLTITLEDPGERRSRWYLPPISLQVLLENAVKHNVHPLGIWVAFDADAITVRNEKRPRPADGGSSRQGLATLNERCRMALGRGIEIVDEARMFTVRVPVRAS